MRTFDGPAERSGVGDKVIFLKLDAVLATAGAHIAAEPKLTALDSIATDGDLGARIKRAAEVIGALPPASFSSGVTRLRAIAARLGAQSAEAPAR